jgi:hypothetical protein
MVEGWKQRTGAGVNKRLKSHKYLWELTSKPLEDERFSRENG